jgi:glycosyltransferase involved in cell wall biosynthesis
MNIVMIGPFGLQPKGTMSVRALPMAQALAARGHSVTLLIPPWDHTADAGREWQEGDVRVVNVALPRRIPVLFHIMLALRLVRRALALRPDVLHFFKPKAYAGLAHFFVWWLRRLRMVPRLRLVVDADDWEQAWNEVQTYSSFQQRFFAWQERWGLTHADTVVVASRELERLVKETGLPAERIFYVPNGGRALLVDHAGGPSHPSDTVRMLWELDDAWVILLYTRFVEFRLERVVEILRRVVSQEPKAKLLVVGEGLFSEEGELDERIAAAGLSSYAVFTGWVEPQRLPSYFIAADVAIFPYDDTQINRAKCSVRLTDLLMAGLPVVADAVGQNMEYILDGQSGLLVPPEDDAAFAEATVRLLRDAALRGRLAATAQKRMQENFAWDTLVEEVEKAYQ